MRILIALLLACSTAFGQKISDLTVATSAADTNTIPIVVSPNVANGLKQITVANLFSGRSGGDAGGTNSRQFGSLNLTNWSNIPTGAMANVVSTTFLTNLAGLFSAANSNLSYAIGTAGTNYTLTASNLVRLVAGLEATNHANAILQSATNYANSVGGGGGLTTNANQFLGVPLAIKDGALLTNTTTYGTASFAGTGVGAVAMKDNAQTEYSQLEAPFDIQTNNVTRWLSNATAGVLVARSAGTGTNQIVAIPEGTGIAYPITVVSGTGNGNTNYTLQAGNVKNLAGSSNINITAVMGGVAGFSYFPQITFTNLSGITWGFGVSSVTNAWRWAGPNGTNPPTTIPAGFELTVAMEVNLTNVIAGWMTNAVAIRQ